MGQTLTNNQEGLSPSTLAIALDVPLVDQTLICHCMALLQQALPKFNQPVESLE